jgi:hypothetical protein
MFNKGGARCLEGVFFFPQVLDPPYVVGGLGGGGRGNNFLFCEQI